MTMSTGLSWMMIASLLVFFSRVVYCEKPKPENLTIQCPRSMKQQYVESRNVTGVHLLTPYDTLGSGTNGSRLTHTTFSFPNENCPECVIDIRDVEGNAEPSRSNDETLQQPTSSNDETLQPPASSNDETLQQLTSSNDETLQPPVSSNNEPSSSWLRIINYALISNINWLWHHLREFQPVEDPWLKLLAATLIQVSASTSVNSGSSLVFKIAIAVAFLASLSALLLHYNNGGRYLIKLGAIAYTIVMYEANVNNLPAPIMWVIAVAFLIAIVTVINA